MGPRTTPNPQPRPAPKALVGKGIYPIPEAARLSKVSPRRIRYWLKRFDSENARDTDRLWQGEHPLIDNKIVLSFLDLQEVRFVHKFLELGVSWRVLRAAHDVARIRYHTEHPFCTRSFATDGKYVIEELKNQSDKIEFEEIEKTQKVFPSVIKPFIKDLDFSDNRLLRWWPLSKNRNVVLDPHRQFGRPIIAGTGVATEILFLAVKAGESEREVANWYEVEQSDVRDAIDFEEWLAAA